MLPEFIKSRFFFPLFFFFVFGFAKAQSWDELNNKFKDYYSKSDYKSAQVYCDSALKLAEKEFGTEHNNYIKSISNMGNLYYAIDDFEKSEFYHLKALELRKKILGTKHVDYASSLYNLGVLYLTINNYDKAELYLLAARDLRIEILGDKNGQYAKVLYHLGNLYKNISNYQKGVEAYLEAIEIYTSISPENPDLPNPLNNLGILYMNEGLFQNADDVFNRSANLRLKILGEKHADYGQSLNNLGLLAMKMGDYGKAEEHYKKASEIRKNALGEKHPDYASTLSNLGVLYELLNDYEAALRYHIKAMEIRKETLGENHPDFAASANNLARIYEKLGNYDKALILYQYAANVWKNAFGENSLEYADALNNLANTWHILSENKKAEEDYIKSVEIKKTVLGMDNNSYASGIFNLAVFYSLTRKYDLAEKKFKESLEIKRRVLGNNHPEIITTLVAVSAFYRSFGKDGIAMPYVLELEKLINQNTRRNYSFLSEKEKELFSYPAFHNYDIIRSFLIDNKKTDPSLAGNFYDIELNTKGMILNSGIEMRQQIKNSGDLKLLELYEKFILKKKSLAAQYSLPLAQRDKKIIELETAVNEIEKSLSRSSASVKSVQEEININWKDVQKKLAKNQVAIEYTFFRYHGIHQWSDSIIYGAVLLRHDSKYPILIPLCEAKQLDSLLKKDNSKDANFVSALYRGTHLINKNKTFSYGSRLFQLIWEPLDKYLYKGDKIYFAPSGILHQIAFAAIPCGNDSLLSERYTLLQLSSTAKLLNVSFFNEKQVESLTVFGGIQYSGTENEIRQSIQKAELNAPVQPSSIPSDIGQKDGMDYLPGTLTESQSIVSIAQENKIKTNAFYGLNALEENYKKLGFEKSPQIIHIATHGFFFPNSKNKDVDNLGSMKDDMQVFKDSDNPLNRAGLLFAGANNAWTGHAIAGIEDGILTAYEAANVPLNNTQLVVLSACETGLGDINESEGVFGLQRSFKMAGAEYMMMSLWKVPDIETSEFMTRFYSTLFSVKNIPDAFIITQNYMKKKYPNEPFKWAAFVLVK